MRSTGHILACVLGAAAGCANANSGGDADGGGGGDGGGTGSNADASCGDACDTDGDGVVDAADDCPGTPPEIPVNMEGCSDSQVNPTLEPDFPPFGLTWTPTGDIGRAGGLTWTYTGIDRGDLFHIYWVVCDDPATPCGVSLDGAIDAPGDRWTFSTLSALGAGRIIFDGAPTILLHDNSTVSLTSRLVMTIVDGNNTPIPFATMSGLGITARTGSYGAQIPATAFTVTAIIEVQESGGSFMPYLDYYDAAQTGMGAMSSVSFGGSFYSE
ncbi:MAG TPA: thrombospondin type 3 repeat-containing protein [Kofleriaceae bacterium]|nr:thrombospondin type 3 repeat-containing protein [Kofleriaceae bacterium]